MVVVLKEVTMLLVFPGWASWRHYREKHQEGEKRMRALE